MIKKWGKKRKKYFISDSLESPQVILGVLFFLFVIFFYFSILYETTYDDNWYHIEKIKNCSIGKNLFNFHNKTNDNLLLHVCIF